MDGWRIPAHDVASATRAVGVLPGGGDVGKDSMIGVWTAASWVHVRVVVVMVLVAMGVVIMPVIVVWCVEGTIVPWLPR
jgi:hypothetical protein